MVAYVRHAGVMSGFGKVKTFHALLGPLFALAVKGRKLLTTEKKRRNHHFDIIALLAAD